MRPLPPPQVPILETDATGKPTGRMSRDWYDYFRDLEAWRRRTDERLTALEP